MRLGWVLLGASAVDSLIIVVQQLLVWAIHGTTFSGRHAVIAAALTDRAFPLIGGRLPIYQRDDGEEDGHARRHCTRSSIQVRLLFSFTWPRRARSAIPAQLRSHSTLISTCYRAALLKDGGRRASGIVRPGSFFRQRRKRCLTRNQR